MNVLQFWTKLGEGETESAQGCVSPSHPWLYYRQLQRDHTVGAGVLQKGRSPSPPACLRSSVSSLGMLWLFQQLASC